MKIVRSGGRGPSELRPLRFERDFIGSALGSCLATCGRTRVICTATADEGVPIWLQGQRQGWVTAEYGMLPGSTVKRRPRDGRRGGGIDGRSAEIQRLLGRSFRPVVDLRKLGEITIHLDCDVIEADGGTRTTAINGAWIALHDALARLRRDGRLSQDPLTQEVAAVSLGLVDGTVLLDLDYEEDRRADADMNVVMTADGRVIEVQASAEKRPFGLAELDQALRVAAGGIASVRAARDAALRGA